MSLTSFPAGGASSSGSALTKVTMPALAEMKCQGKLISALTAYDYATSRLVDEAGIDLVLVGDSLAMVVLGHENTLAVTVDEMLHHTRSVARGATHSFIIGDMPIRSYGNPESALKNARRFLQAGAKAVKIEGNKPEVLTALVKAGIPVMGHLGLLPQTAKTYKVQGKDEEAAAQIYHDALALEKLGAFALVLECIPRSLAEKITQSVKIPTIGIGAGPECSGQVLVLHDILGLSDFEGKFVKKYCNLKDEITIAVGNFKNEVQTGQFPTLDKSFQ